MPCGNETYFHFIYDYYKTTYVLCIPLYFILFERSKVKLRQFKKSVNLFVKKIRCIIATRSKKVRKSRF